MVQFDKVVLGDNKNGIGGALYMIDFRLLKVNELECVRNEAIINAGCIALIVTSPASGSIVKPPHMLLLFE